MSIDIHIALSPETKASDYIGSDPKIVHLCQTLGIALGFGDVSIGQLCVENDVPVELFICLCRMINDSNYIPDISEFGEKEARCIISCIEHFHKEYRSVLLPTLHSNVHKIAELCPDNVKRVVNKFFDEYDEEMNRHIENEEKNGCFFENDADSFRNLHDDVEIKLDDFKSILVKYVPGSCNIPERYTAVIQVIHIIESIRLHTRIEENIFFPLVAELKEKNRSIQ